MLIWTILKLALKSLLANKLRSFLATLGIIIGVGAVIAMVALGTGAQKRVLDSISSLGADLLIVRPGMSGMRGVRSSVGRQSLKLEDAEAIVRETPGVLRIAPVVSGNCQLKNMNKNTNCAVTGGSMTYFAVRGYVVEKGRPFTEAEAERSARVAVIGSVTATTLFGENDPLGETIKIKGINFTVIGVLKTKGDQGFFNPDDMAIVPYTTAMKQLYGQNYLREIDIQSEPAANLTEVQEKVTALLRKRHRIAAGADDDFNIQNQAEILSMVESNTDTLKFLLAGIAGISLLVGGIGIMNIMLVTVTERTREIGVRKAIGARDRDILRQFLVESVVISGIGGVLGILLGVAASRIIGLFTEFAPLVQTSSVLLAIGVSAGVGVFFGYYPARRAAKLDPIEALRYE